MSKYTHLLTSYSDLHPCSWGITYGTGYRSKKALPASQILVLLDWVPNLSQVTGIRISTRDNCHPNTCKNIIKKLAAAKKKAKKPMDITKLVLHGPKIYGSLISEMIKNEIGRSLTSLSFVSVSQTQKTKIEGSVAEFFRSCSQLEELYIPQNMAVAAGSLRSTGESCFFVVFSHLLCIIHSFITFLKIEHLAKMLLHGALYCDSVITIIGCPVRLLYPAQSSRPKPRPWKSPLIC